MPLPLQMHVIAAPNIGFLEQALPFTYSLKESAPGSQINFFFPKPGTALQLLTGWKIVELINSIGDSFNFPISRNVWLKVPNATKAGELSRSLRYLVSGSRFLQDQLPLELSSAIDRIVYVLLRLMGFAATRGIGETRPGKSLALLDIGVVNKPYLKAFRAVLSDCDAISIIHGLDIFDGSSVKNTATASWISSRKDTNLLVCAQSEHEVPHYVRSFGLRESEVIVAGIPRHHPTWVAFMTTKPPGQLSIKRKGYILLVSRPGGSPYLPTVRKETYIAEVAKFASSVGLKILVKLHPREINADVYDRILGPRNRGQKWDFTNSHVFELHDDVVFAVSFFSGVPLDLLQLEIPTIERLDLRGIPEWDNEKAHRDVANHPVTLYQKLGLVRGATTEAEFFATASEILSHRDRVVAELRSNYQKHFFVPPLDASSILEKFSG